MRRTRQASLVLIAADHTVRGIVGPYEVAEPWWQETGPVTDLVPGSAVLRLLEATPDPVEEMGGQVTYLVQHDGPLPHAMVLRPWSGTLNEHPLRHPWAAVNGPGADLDWVASVVNLDPDRNPRQQRTWNLSAIWSIPTLGPDRRQETVWLKCVPPFFAHEAAVLNIMADQPVPTLLAGSDHRILLASMDGEDGFAPSATEQLAIIDSLVDIQLASVDRVDQLLAAGVPDGRSGQLITLLTDLVERLAPNDSVLGPLIDGLPERMAAVDAQGLPDVLLHGDPHGGNCRRGVEPPLWFDWGDAFIGNPLLDVAALHRMSEATVDHWLQRWVDAFPGANARAAWELLEPVALLRMPLVYQTFCDNIEPSERIYHAYDIDQSLEAVRIWLRNHQP